MRKDDLTLVKLKPHEPGSDARCHVLRLLAYMPGLQLGQIEQHLGHLLEGGRVAVRDAMQALERDGRIVVQWRISGGEAGWANAIGDDHQRLVQPTRPWAARILLSKFGGINV